MTEREDMYNAETTDTSYDHVLKYTGIFGGVQGIKILASMVRTKLTVYILGPVGLGLISVYNTISEFVNSSSNLGVPLNATRRTSELFESGSMTDIEQWACTIRTWVFWTSLLSVFICTVLSPILSYFFFEHDMSRFTDIMLVIPIVVSMLVAEGECSILKGLRQLKRIAFIETMVALSTLVFTIPFYYFCGLKGIIWGLCASSIVACLIHMYFSVRLVSYKIEPFSSFRFTDGLPLIKVGIPYVLAGVANSGLAMIISALMLMHGTLEDVGFYRCGFSLMVAYAGMVFVALDADYYPRLSSVNHDTERMNAVVNQQIDVCVLLTSPLLIVYLLCMPFVIHILYDPEFMIVQDMAICSGFYIFLRGIMLPVAYTALAKADSVLYLFMEVLYDIVFGFLIWWLYNEYGLTGAGIALSIGALYDVLAVLLVYGWRYGCRVQRKTLAICVVQFCFVLLATALCLLASGWAKFGLGALLFALSAAYSIRKFGTRSSFLQHLLRKSSSKE